MVSLSMVFRSVPKCLAWYQVHSPFLCLLLCLRLRGVMSCCSSGSLVCCCSGCFFFFFLISTVIPIENEEKNRESLHALKYRLWNRLWSSAVTQSMKPGVLRPHSLSAGQFKYRLCGIPFAWYLLGLTVALYFLGYQVCLTLQSRE